MSCIQKIDSEFLDPLYVSHIHISKMSTPQMIFAANDLVEGDNVVGKFTGTGSFPKHDLPDHLVPVAIHVMCFGQMKRYATYRPKVLQMPVEHKERRTKEDMHIYFDNPDSLEVLIQITDQDGNIVNNSIVIVAIRRPSVKSKLFELAQSTDLVSIIETKCKFVIEPKQKDDYKYTIQSHGTIEYTSDVNIVMTL